MKDWNPKRWLRILLPTVLVIVWVAIAGLGGPTFGKISGVSTNDQAGFLPASAQSTEVQNLQAGFRTSKDVPAIVVIENTSGAKLTPADFAAFGKLSVSMAAVPGVATPAAGSASSVIGPIPSADGTAVEYIVPLTASGEALKEKSLIYEPWSPREHPPVSPLM